MKKIVKVVKNNPNELQTTDISSISNIIGETFKVIEYDNYDESVQIYSSKHNGKIVLNKDEYIFVR